MRWTERQKADYVRTVEVVSVIEELLGELFGLIQLETGSHTTRDGVTRVDYVLKIADYEEARKLSRALQQRHVSAGVRPEGKGFVLRVSKNDLMEAFVRPAQFSLSGVSVQALLEQRVAELRRRGPDEGFLPAAISQFDVPAV
jgi:hypothetical protein